MSRIATKRLSKELNELKSPGGCPHGIDILVADDLKEWTFRLQVLGESCYQDESFALRFVFPNSYPIEPPEVTFVVSNEWQPPVHPHVYSNGHICASILASGWSPVLNAAKICLTLQSMLASCKNKQRPPDNDRYVKNAPISPKDTRFVFHDDNV